MVSAVCQVTRKGHSDFIAIRKNIMQVLGWRRGDHLVAVVWEDFLILKKLPLGAVVDEIAGAMLRRANGEKAKTLDGAWNRKRGQPKPEL